MPELASGHQVTDLARRRRELADPRLQNVIGHREVEVARGARGLRMRARGKPAGVPGNDHREAAALVRIRFRMFVNVEQTRAVEHVAVALRGRLELGQEIGELLHVPAADVPQHPLPIGAVAARSFTIGVSVNYWTG